MNVPRRAVLKLRTPARSRLAAAAAIVAAGAAHAGNFQTDGGVDVRWSLGTTLGSSWRATDRDPALVAVGNGGLSGIQNNDGNLNFDKWDPYSTSLNVLGEVDVRKNGLGFFARAKAWYDYTLDNTGVPHGHFANAYVPGEKLDDSGFDRLSKFRGASLLDAYASGEFLLGANTLNVRLGNQVVNWGESLFVPGVNQFNAFDLTAAHRPGAQVKEILRPLPQLFASLSLTEEASVEAFYQLGWRKHVLDGCGTYWSPADLVNCSSVGTLAGPANLPSQVMYNGIAALGVPNMQLGRTADREPGDNGQFGVAARLRLPSIDTDFGLYYAQYNTRAPNLSVVLNPTVIPGSVWSVTIPGQSRAMQLQYDYSADRIKVMGLSFSRLVGGWSVFGEVSHSRDVPVQINGVDLLNGVVAGIGPMGALAASTNGSYVPGYVRKSKTQAQLATLQVLPRLFGADNLTVIGELALQHWSGIGDPSTGPRYGRAFVFGTGPVLIPGGTDLCSTAVPAIGVNAPLNPNAAYCENKGYATPTAWGYRALLELSYPDVFASINVKPRVFLSHDVKGWSADGVFSEGRVMVSPGVRMEYTSRYYLDLSYARFARAKYDEMHDRDFVSMVIGLNF